MYYEEGVVDGVLCHRSAPNGEWIPFTAEELLSKITKLKRELDWYEEEYYDKKMDEASKSGTYL